MIKTTRHILLFLLLTGFVSCAGIRGGSTMSGGERLFRANCRSCHILPKPVKYDDAAWDSLVNRYGGRLKLSAADRHEILEFMQSMNGQ